MEIGSTSPRYQEFGLLYPDSIGLQKALCKYFTVIVKLCKQAILFIRKPFFSQLSSSILKPFTSEFSSFSADLMRLATAIRGEISLASLQVQKDEFEANATFRAVTSRFSTKEMQRNKERKNKKIKFKLLDACSTYNHQIAWKQAKKLGRTGWIFEQDMYKQWRHEQQLSSTLWCTGILGSGKTVLAANVVEDVTSIPAATVGYFFCRHDEAESLKARTIIGSIARQLLSPLKLDLIDRVTPENLGFLDTAQVLDYVEEVIPSDQQSYVILDGLDECEESEVMLLMECLKRMLTFKHVFHLYCSSRPNLPYQVSALLHPQWKVLMPEAGKEIVDYINSDLQQRLETGALSLGDPSIIIAIQDTLSKGAQGMSVTLN